MASYTLQGFTSDASSPDLDATNLNEMDNAIKKGHDFADGASATPEAGKAMVWPENASGTFTPTLSFGGASTGITYSTRVGRYVKIGDSVWVNIWIILSSKGTATGDASVRGLPFTIGASVESRGVSMAGSNHITFTTQGPVIAIANNGETTIDLRSPKTGDSMDRLTNANVANNSLLSFSMQYFV